jgi:transcriptional regulator with XRE-family HTH domain
VTERVVTDFDVGRLGARIRRLRRDAGVSLTEVARRLGVSASAVSQIETGVMQPSVSRLVEIMGVLDLPLTMVFDESLALAFPSPYEVRPAAEELRGVSITRAGAARTVDLEQGVVYRRLTPRPLPGTEFYESVYPPGAASGTEGALVVHSGSETGVVTSGTLVFQFADGEVELSTGDAIYFRAGKGHRIVNRSGAPAVATWLTVGVTD